jgi:hypothetical protein
MRVEKNKGDRLSEKKDGEEERERLLIKKY